MGVQTATQLIVETNEFKDFATSRRLACYAGIVPFEFRSGTSVRKQTKVSGKTNKKLKTLLQLVVLSYARSNANPNEFVAYERKVKEGKNKMSVLNALKNKVIHTIFSLVTKNQKPSRKT